jgi:hypothetical protein
MHPLMVWKPGFDNICVPKGVTGLYWMCDTNIRQTEYSATWTLYKSHSVYYSSGAGFSVLQGGKTTSRYTILVIFRLELALLSAFRFS